MKRLIILLLVIIAATAWWATRQEEYAPPAAEESRSAAAYPSDFAERLNRVGGLTLKLQEPLPTDIPWETAEGHQSLGHAEARKGGCVRVSNAGSFPAHFHRFGGGMPQFFHLNLQAATEIPLVAKHPLSGKPTAGVAEAWGIVGNTVYFRLNPAARYNNGRPVRAGDYLLAVLLQAEQRCAEYETLTSLATRLCIHGEHLLSLTMRNQADVLLASRLLIPAEPAFYAEFNSRFKETYAQRIPPATGAYRVSHVQSGRSIKLQRVTNWWGETLPLYRHRFNADTLEYHFLTSEAQVWEFLLRGKLDAVQTRNIAAWQERAEPAEHLHRTVYDAEYPLPPYGIALNARTLPQVELRRGLLHAMDMDKGVQLIMRGEGQRLRTFHSGYGALTPQATPQYQYNPGAARAAFARAGYTHPGPDGILRRADGTRLSVTLLYTPNEKISTLMSVLIQSAANCGAEIKPEPVPWQICQKRLQERSHQLVFWAMPASETPEPAQFFSPQAEPEASPFGLDAANMNEALAAYAAHPGIDTLSRIDQLVYEHAIWLPGWKENRVYLAHQPRLRIPPSPWCFDALDAHFFWVTPAP